RRAGGAARGAVAANRCTPHRRCDATSQRDRTRGAAEDYTSRSPRAVHVRVHGLRHRPQRAAERQHHVPPEAVYAGGTATETAERDRAVVILISRRGCAFPDADPAAAGRAG